jgi:integrase
MTGFGTRIRAVRGAAGLEHWSAHDLRRSMRTGLARLAVDRNVSEMILNHRLPGDLERAYNLYSYWDERLEAAERWADHVMSLVKPPDRGLR